MSRSESSPLIPNEVNGLSRNSVYLLAGTLWFGVMLAALDTTIVTTLLGHIASDLQALDSVSWVATGYTVGYSAFQPLYGKFSDIWGRKKVSILCTFIFGIGCFMCGSAKCLSFLVTGRFVSGFGAGGMLSMSTITISDYVPLRSRGVFQGLGNVAFGTGASLGGLIGGWATSVGGWRLAFNIQVPLALLSVILQFVLIQEVVHSREATSATARKSKWSRIDWLGCLSLVSALLLSMFAITTGGSQFAWNSFPILAFFAGSSVLLCLFIYWETQMAVEPVIPISVLTNRTVISACLTNFFGSGLTYAFIYYSPIFLQAMCHYSYNDIGSRIVLNFVGVAIGSLGSGLLVRRTGSYFSLCLVSLVLTTSGCFMLMISPYLGHAVSHSALYQCTSYFLQGLGYAAMLTITLIALIAAVNPHQQATSTAAQYTFRGAGSSLGIALAAAVFQNVLGSKLINEIGTDTKKKRKVIDSVSKSLEAIWDQPKKYQGAIVRSYVSAGVAVQTFCIVWGFLALASAVCIEEHDLERNAFVPASDDEHMRPSTPQATLHHEP